MTEATREEPFKCDICGEESTVTIPAWMDWTGGGFSDCGKHTQRESDAALMRSIRGPK